MKTAEKARFVSYCSHIYIYLLKSLIFTQRRCIHDEYGRIDPVKAQERSKPRAANSSKRVRLNDEDVVSPANKKLKQESTSPSSRPANLHRSEGEAQNTQSVPSSAAADESLSSNGIYPEPGMNSQPAVTDAEKVPVGQTSYASPPALQTDAVVTKEVDSASAPSQPTATLVSPPTSLADDTDVPHEHANGEVQPSTEGEHPTVMHTPSSSSRHSSRQPRQVDRFAPDPPVAKASNPKSVSHTASMHHSSLGKATPAPSSTMKRPYSRPSSSHAKTSASPTSEKKSGRPDHSSTSPGQPGKNTKHDQAHFAEDEPDIESLRLIRELQEQEFELRKHSTRV